MIAFEVFVNERRVCVASVGDAGVLSAILSFSRSAGREPSKEDLFLSVGGLANEEHVHWTNPFEYLTVGDAVRIRVVDAGEVDPPTEHVGTLWPPTTREESEPQPFSPPSPSDSYRAVVSFARDDARYRGTSELEPAHLLLGVMNVDDSLVLEAFARLKLSREIVANLVERELPPPTGTTAGEIRESKMARRTLAFAQFEAQVMRSPAVGPAHILIGVVRAGESVAARALEIAGFNVYGFREEIFGIERTDS